MKKAKRTLKQQFESMPGISIVGQANGDSADYVVCARNGTGYSHADDVRSVCAVCGGGIHYRPYAPARPPKICLDCAFILARKGMRAAN
ncbi:MAG: hypothetical protein ACYDCQ_06310 [Dehalococcoidia bacterium]